MNHPLRTALFSGWCALLVYQSNTAELVSDYGAFSLLGVIGAIFANATGAGGGVIFVPFFNQMGMAPLSIVATSFGIQCCGMTAGAITWWRYFRQNHKSDAQWSMLANSLLLTVGPSLCGIWVAQFASHSIPILSVLKGNVDDLHLGFGIFSIVLAMAIFASAALLKKTHFKVALAPFDAVLLPVIAFFGGVITAWLSVGVGELVAVYLIIRGFNITMAIAVAVILTAFSVWGAIGYHSFVTLAVNWQIVLFAGAGAVVGGILARHVVLAFSPTRLKVFFGTWVLIMGLSGLPIL